MAASYGRSSQWRNEARWGEEARHEAAVAQRAARQARRRCARQALEGRLAAALRRVQELEANLASSAACAAAASDDGETKDECPTELTQRLALVAPVLRASLSAREAEQPLVVPRILVARRNAAVHCFTATATRIAKMTMPMLNRLQRAGRPRRAPAASTVHSRDMVARTTTRRAFGSSVFGIALLVWLISLGPLSMLSVLDAVQLEAQPVATKMVQLDIDSFGDSMRPGICSESLMDLGTEEEANDQLVGALVDPDVEIKAGRIFDPDGNDLISAAELCHVMATVHAGKGWVSAAQLVRRGMANLDEDLYEQITNAEVIEMIDKAFVEGVGSESEFAQEMALMLQDLLEDQLTATELDDIMQDTDVLIKKMLEEDGALLAPCRRGSAYLRIGGGGDHGR